MRESFGDRIFGMAIVLLLVVIGIITLFPLYYVFVVSFTEPSEYIEKYGFVLFPSKWSVGAYEYLLSTSAFIRATGVSAFLATVGTLLSLMITAAFSFGLSRKRLRGRKVMMIMVMVTILFNPGIIPVYLLVRDLGLINSVWALIVPVLTSGWYVILMKSFFDSIPVELEEAAMIDGCNDLSIFFRIILPLSVASLAAFGLFYAVAYWNTFFSAVLYINDFTKVPLQIVLRNMLIDSDTSVGGALAVEMASDKQLPTQTIKMAAVVVSTLPILMVYPFLQKHFTKGVMLGSVKG
ncbi:MULTISPECIES: carbohydrate ABC transporter permease [Paenibacillus]|uniref:Carbohydrate ABC transporter permease n=2 Tax=Paenibacillus TaxID=44249 RepID=A0ABU6D5T0_9BACL|nr:MULTISPECIES: carbohydrate ABC transporter permease [Paenibacillus]MBA2938810.1 carbohydrate ABC transporter permease [Paenibacillus sp. CGMCC 1.16610]MCY9660065.1 carbohydrate ABC transporter permease [Paenibacillus anseongense]MEB4793076.1 carbohydrate ABC transporter permease [Paenibacillus chondroitinus]MVQ34772.1 ABC transporter permease subunit [Paenibacillus anseongense]